MYRFSQAAQQVESSFIRDILTVSQQPEVISFAGGLPDPELFPLDQLKDSFHQAEARFGGLMYQYGETAGVPPLREYLAAQASTTENPVAIENILMTTGSQQALDIIARTFLNPGDVVLVEAPSYVGALQVFNGVQANIVALPGDDDGVDMAALAAATQKYQPKLVYLMPNFQNPTGKTYSLARRRQIQQFLQQQDSLLAVEDDPYGALRFTEEQWPTLAELAPDKVLRLCSFSKTVAPSFRLGWVQGPAPVLSQLAKFKQVADLHSSCILQYQLLCFLQSGYLAQQVAKVRQVYGKRCQLMVDAVQTQLSAWVNLVPPKGGMFIWCEQGLVDSMRLFKECVQHRVAFVPGQAFYPQLDETELDRATPQRGMRLNFSHTSEANIAEGVHRIAKVLQSFG